MYKVTVYRKPIAQRFLNRISALPIRAQELICKLVGTGIVFGIIFAGWLIGSLLGGA